MNYLQDSIDQNLINNANYPLQIYTLLMSNVDIGDKLEYLSSEYEYFSNFKKYLFHFLLDIWMGDRSFEVKVNPEKLNSKKIYIPRGLIELIYDPQYRFFERLRCFQSYVNETYSEDFIALQISQTLQILVDQVPFITTYLGETKPRIRKTVKSEQIEKVDKSELLKCLILERIREKFKPSIDNENLIKKSDNSIFTKQDVIGIKLLHKVPSMFVNENILLFKVQTGEYYIKFKQRCLVFTLEEVNQIIFECFKQLFPMLNL